MTPHGGSGLRTIKRDRWTGTHNYTWQGGSVLHDSKDDTVHTPGVSQRVNGTDRFFHTDWLGSSRYLSDSTGNNFPSGLRYDGYGGRTSTGGSVAHPSDFQWAGGWGYQKEYADGSDPGIGLTYIQNRYYDSHAGRFMSLDPIRFAGGLNLYEYALGNPVGMVDPLGLSPGDAYDVIAVSISWAEFAAAPNPISFAWAVADTATALVPGIPGTGIRHVGKVQHLLQGGKAQKALAATCSKTARLTQEALDHIVLRHWSSSSARNAGKFAVGTRAKDLKQMIETAVGHATPRANTRGRPGHIYDFDFGREIGVNIQGSPATRLRVVVGPDGMVKTAFPF
jgi:RHS repeat-associated protein